MKLHKPQIRTRNFSSDDLKAKNTGLGAFSMRSIVRFGSRTSTQEAFPKSFGHRPIIEVNTPEACHNSGNKIAMKTLFTQFGVKSARWRQLIHANTPMQDEIGERWNIFPAIIKHKNSCKGKGIYLIESSEQLAEFIGSHQNQLASHIIEEYKNFPKEYRLHVTQDGCFYTCRKMLKQDAEERWHRHDMNSVWIMEENPLFEKPSNWDEIVGECVKALNAVGLDVGACDIKVQSEKNRRLPIVPDFIIMEINSAPSFGQVTIEKYREELPRIINKKIREYGSR